MSCLALICLFSFTLFPFCSFLNYLIEGYIEMNCLKHLLYHRVWMIDLWLFLLGYIGGTRWPRVLAGRKRFRLLLYMEKQHPYMSLLHIFIQLYFSSLLRSLCHKLWWKYILFQFQYYFHYINNISFFVSLLRSLRRDLDKKHYFSC